MQVVTKLDLINNVMNKTKEVEHKDTLEDIFNKFNLTENKNLTCKTIYINIEDETLRENVKSKLNEKLVIHETQVTDKVHDSIILTDNKVDVPYLNTVINVKELTSEAQGSKTPDFLKDLPSIQINNDEQFIDFSITLSDFNTIENELKKLTNIVYSIRLAEAKNERIGVDKRGIIGSDAKLKFIVRIKSTIYNNELSLINMINLLYPYIYVNIVKETYMNIINYNNVEPIDVRAQTDLFEDRLNMIDAVDQKYNMTLAYHQIQAIVAMMRSKFMILHAEVGVGKTRIAIAHGLISKAKRILYFTEAGNVFEVQKEFEKLGLKDKMIIIRSASEINNIKDSTQFIVTSYSLLPRLHDDSRKKLKSDICIFDECHNLKNNTTARFKSAMKLEYDSVYFMSGTTITNNVSEIISYMELMKQDKIKIRENVHNSDILYVKSNYKTAKNMEKAPETILQLILKHTNSNLNNTMHDSYTNIIKMNRGQNSLKNSKLLFNRLSFVITKDNEDLIKNKSFRTKAKELLTVVHPSQQQLDLYLKTIEHTKFALEQASNITETFSLKHLTTLLKVTEIPETIDASITKTNKDEKIMRIVADKFEHKDRNIIVFTHFVAASAKLSKQLADAGHKVFLLESSMNVKKRFEIIEEYRNSKEAVIVGSVGILGKGFNLEVADTVVMADIPWSPYLYEQSIGRILRPNQTGQPEIINVVTKGLIDEYKLNTLSSKRDMINHLTKDVKIRNIKISFSEFLRNLIKAVKLEEEE